MYWFCSCFIFIFLYIMEVKSQTTNDVKISRKTCLLKPQEGPCRANIPMYYFDPEKGDCDRFLWGGCQGNGNRFDTLSTCLDECISKPSLKAIRPRWCFLNFDYGFCFGAVKRYYYDHLWQVCKERIFSGCGGNKNNFYSFEQCEEVCRFGHAAIHTTRKDKNRGETQLIINPKEQSTKTIAVNTLDPKRSGDFT